jgi:hypothetical protein
MRRRKYTPECREGRFAKEAMMDSRGRNHA